MTGQKANKAMETDKLTTSFKKYFKVIVADTPELRDEVYRIRYDVYCRELQYECPENYPSGLEQDAYDSHSYHCLLLHRPSRQFAGCVRLVYNDPENLQSLLPFEAKCADTLFGSCTNTLLPHRSEFGEISRIAIPENFRRRKMDAGSPIGDTNVPPVAQQEQRRFPYIPLGLYLAAAAAGLELGLNGVFAMMEPRLVRHLQRFGIVFEQVGDIIEYRGKRAAFYIDREGLYNNMTPPIKNLLDIILSDISKALRTGTC
jgi:N-acyl amino acid synthase of PEP-CTERM/exosortase system